MPCLDDRRHADPGPAQGLRELPRKLEDQLLPGLEERLSALRDDATGAMDMAWIYGTW